MKQPILFLFTMLFFISAQSQPWPDSIKAKYITAKTDAEKGEFLVAYFGRASTADSITTAHALELLASFKKQNDPVGADYTQLFIANVLVFKGDYSTSLNMALVVLSNCEKRKDEYGIMNANHVIALAYLFFKNYDQAVEYLKKAIPPAQTIGTKENLSQVYNDIGVTYALALKPDSGLFYAQKSISLDTELKDNAHLAVSLSTLAENYMAGGDYEIAIPFLRKCIYYYSIQETDQNRFGILYVNNDFAQAFLEKKQYDSAAYYAQLSIQSSVLLGYQEQTLRSYEYLYKIYEKLNQQDSISKYFRLAMMAKDSLFSMEKTKSLEATNFQEKLRQQEVATEKQKSEEERHKNIQYALIALGIISFLILFFLLSRSIIVTEKWISFFGILGLLIVFEFINLLIHPYLENATQHSPVLMLLALVALASLLIPLHHRLEKWIKEKMTEKNKKIRLAAAKKTIEQLEGNNN